MMAMMIIKQSNANAYQLNNNKRSCDRFDPETLFWFKQSFPSFFDFIH